MNPATAPRKRSGAVRLPWIRPAPDGRPSCPGCGREVTLSQPDSRDPNRLLGTCDNGPCREWTFYHRVEGRWQVARRIPAGERRNPPWPVVRPDEDTARSRRA